MRDLNGLARPTVPSGAIQQRVLAETEKRHGVVGPAPALPDDAGVPTALRAALGQTVAELAPQIVELSHNIRDHPEASHEEHHIVAMITELLRRHDIEFEVDIYGMDTALRAEISRDGGADAMAGGSCELVGTIAILAEYDTLPDIDHGCGHSAMCTNPMNVFLALAALTHIRPGSLPGRVVLQTTPAEEDSIAKKILAVRDILDGVDAAIQTYFYAHNVIHQTWLGVQRLCVIFHDVSVHAASQSFMGRNALDAVTPALTGIGPLRQQMLPMNRLHAIITDSGQVPNITPERAELSIMVRLKYPEALKEIAERVEEVLHGATFMTGTGVEILTFEYCNEVPVCDSGLLLTFWVRSQRERGRDPLATGVLPGTIAVNTDFDSMSQRILDIHPLIKVVDQFDVTLHTPAIAEVAGTPTRDMITLDGAYGLVAAALDWLHDIGLHQAVHAGFEATGGTIDVADFWEE